MHIYIFIFIFVSVYIYRYACICKFISIYTYICLDIPLNFCLVPGVDHRKIARYCHAQNCLVDVPKVLFPYIFTLAAYTVAAYC